MGELPSVAAIQAGALATARESTVQLAHWLLDTQVVERFQRVHEQRLSDTLARSSSTWPVHTLAQNPRALSLVACAVTHVRVGVGLRLGLGLGPLWCVRR
jgi:hypothetical protein